MATLDRALLNAINRVKKPAVAVPKRAPPVKNVPAARPPPVKNVPAARPPAIGAPPIGVPTFRGGRPGVDSNAFSSGVIGGTNRPAMGMPTGFTPDPAVVTYGSDGKMYGSPGAARAAGVYQEPKSYDQLSLALGYGIQPGMNPSSGVVYPNQPGGDQFGYTNSAPGRVEQNYRGIPGLVNATAPTPNFGPITSPAPAPAQPAMGAPSSFYGSMMSGLFGGQPNMTQYGNGGIGYPMGYPMQQPVGGGLFGQPMTQYGNGGIGYPMGYPMQQPNMGQQYAMQQPNMGQQYAMQQPNMNQQPQNFGNAGFSALNTNMGQQPQETRSANDFDSFAYRPL